MSPPSACKIRSAVLMSFCLAAGSSDALAKPKGTPAQWTAKAARVLDAADVRRFSPALRLLTRAAKAGYGPAFYQLGRAYSKGLGVPVDAGKARARFLRGAKLGDPASAVAMARIAESKGQEGTEEALRFYRKAADASSEKTSTAPGRRAQAIAWGALGRAYLVGVGVPQDPAEARLWLDKAATGGDLDGMVALAQMLTSGSPGVAPDLRAAARWLREAARSKHAEAAYELARRTVSGAGVDADPQAALRWFRVAAKAGHLPARYEVGMLSLSLAKPGDQAKESEAFQILQEAAEASHPFAQFWVGVCYDQGRGVERNYGQAFRWYQKAANQGLADGQYQAGLLLDTGRGAAADPAAAAKYYFKAVAQGHAAAEYNLGVLYNQGRGVAQDNGRALALFKASATKGNRDGLFNLAAFQYQGIATPKDHEAAAANFRRAAEAGLADAQFTLAQFYEAGVGMPKDLGKAERWYKAAADQGHPTAQSRVRASRR